MVGRLVENEEIAFGGESQGKGESLTLASRQLRDGDGRVGETEAVGHGDRPAIVADDVADRAVVRERRILGERCDPETRRAHDGACVGLFRACDDAQERRLAGSVPTDDADALPSADPQ